VPREVIAAVHGAWASFAASGDPAGTGAIPTWPEYDPNARPTMVFNNKTVAVGDPDGDGRASWDGIDLSL